MPTDVPSDMPSDLVPPLAGGDLIKRHKLSTRIWHWVSAGLMLVLLMSGLMIFNVHPRLYWGDYGANPDPAWLEIGAEDGRGYVRIGDKDFTTTGVLGVSDGPFGPDSAIAFPSWATIPAYYDLVTARRWHLSMAWFLGVGTLIFGLWGLLTGHVTHVLMPSRAELSPRHILSEMGQHARLRMPCGAEACRYNIFQKLTYLGVTAGLIPLIILTGLTMSPWVNAQVPFLLDLFGGRQSARSIHFIAATLLVLFVIVHLFMVIAAGPLNEMRSMITGCYRLPKERPEKKAKQ